MEKTFAKGEELAAHVKEYINNRITSVKLNAAEKSSKFTANILTALALIAIISVFVFFVSLALAFLFAKWTGEYYLGFLIVSCLYLVAVLILWFARDPLLRSPILKSFLKQIFNEEEENEQD